MGNQRNLGPLGTELVNLMVAFDTLLMLSIVPFLFAVGTSFVPGWQLLHLLFRKRL